MLLFRLMADRNGWGKDRGYDIDASHKWGLPGVKCSVCGRTWSARGVSYPTVDLSVLPSVERFKDLWPVAEDELEELRSVVRPLVPTGAYLPPGTNFGPLIGWAQGELGDFTWSNPTTMLARGNTINRLNSAGVRLVSTARAKLEFKSPPSVDLSEVQIEPVAMLAPVSFLTEETTCHTCGYTKRKLEVVVVEGYSVPSDVDLFRPQNFPTVILSTDRFAEAVREMDLSGIFLEEVSVV